MDENQLTTNPKIPETVSINREHFIPILREDLVRVLAGDASLSDADRRRFRSLCRILEATIHFEYHDRLNELKSRYAPYDPDRETRLIDDPDRINDPEQPDALFECVMSLLERGNFRRLDRTQIEQTLAAKTDWGIRLDVDFSVFERLEVYTRGETTTRRTRRHWRSWYRAEEIEVPIYQRLLIMFRLKDNCHQAADDESGAVSLKLFKNIPRVDLEMLLPGTRVRMTLLDRCRILLPTISGLALTIFKIVKGAMALAFAGVYGLLGFLGLVGGTVGYGVKSFFGYLRTKDRYQLNLTRNLYFQNLDNNAGVLYRLLDEAEEQEFREAILAYSLLRRHAPPSGWTLADIDQAAESYLQSTLDIEADFEVGDAVRKLARFGLVSSLPGQRFTAVSLDAALEGLDRNWDEYFTWNSSQRASDPRPRERAA